mgnify:FL=1
MHNQVRDRALQTPGTLPQGSHEKCLSSSFLGAEHRYERALPVQQSIGQLIVRKEAYGLRESAAFSKEKEKKRSDYV